MDVTWMEIPRQAPRTEFIPVFPVPASRRDRARSATGGEVLAAGSLRLLSRVPAWPVQPPVLELSTGELHLFIEHHRESPGSAALAARRAGYPWPEKLGVQLV